MEPAAEGGASEPTVGGGSPNAQDGEVRVVGRGGTWWVRVLGRAGRAEARAAPLLLLGFRSEDGNAPTLESLVAGRSLADLPDELLESALARAVEIAGAGRKRPFFEEADGARRT